MIFKSVQNIWKINLVIMIIIGGSRSHLINLLIWASNFRINLGKSGLMLLRWCRDKNQTRMHSSMMRTARVLTISQHALCRGLSARGLSPGGFLLGGGFLPRGMSAHLRGGGVCPGGVWPGGVSVQGGVWPGGVWPGGCLSMEVSTQRGGWCPST